MNCRVALPPPPATDAQLAAWVKTGKANGGALEILWHARDVYEGGGARDDCPFTEVYPAARERWLWFFGVWEKTVAAKAPPPAPHGQCHRGVYLDG